MFLDASAIVAILSREPGWQDLVQRMSGPTYISPLTRFEAILSLALVKAKPTGRRPTPEIMALARDSVDAFSLELGAVEIEITGRVGSLAIEASMRYGKAVGHPADLNFGDCFVYACAKALNVPLLSKGNDFAQTDLA